MNRLGRIDKPEDLKFDYDLFDAVQLSDGRRALITGYGIYDNQYWCEVCYPDGVYLEAADYFSSDLSFNCIHVINKINEQRNFIVNGFIKALEEMENMFHGLSYSKTKNIIKQSII
jgi:hypothetical protein